MNSLITAAHRAAALAALSLAVPATAAGGDLLVAPTRLVLDGTRGAEVVLNNIGETSATYRISAELRRMTPEGALQNVAVENATAAEKAMLDMLVFTPRRVTLQPNRPQTVRVGVRLPAGLATGEYRAHLLFRAIPDAPATPAPGQASAAPTRGFSVSLTPIYGVTIPVIVRQGQLTATAAISNPRFVTRNGAREFAVDLARSGARSVYGEISVFRPGEARPLMQVRGIAVYPELNARQVYLPVTPEQVAALRGPVIVRFAEDRDSGGTITAEARGELR